MASDINSVVIQGTMVRDPLFKTIPSGTNLCNFSIACNRYFKRGDGFEKEASFFDVQCWAALAQDVIENGKKGVRVEISGRLKQERWADNQGQNRSRVLIVAESVKYSDDRQKAESEAYPF